MIIRKENGYYLEIDCDIYICDSRMREIILCYLKDIFDDKLCYYKKTYLDDYKSLNKYSFKDC